MSLHVLEIVVDGVESTGGAVLAELGGTTGNIVEVVTVEGNLVAWFVSVKMFVMIEEDVRAYHRRRTS